MGTGFSFNQYRALTGEDLKKHLAENGETFYITGIQQDMGTDGKPLWKLNVPHEDDEDGVLYFAMDDSDRSEALAALASAFDSGEVAAQPAVLRSVRTRSNRTYYFLADPES